MPDVYTWRDSPTGPPDEPSRKCGLKCEHWHQCPTHRKTGFCDVPEVFEHTMAGEDCWL